MFIALPVSEFVVFLCMILTTVFLILGSSGDEYAGMTRVNTDKVIVVTHSPVSISLVGSYVFGQEQAKTDFQKTEKQIKYLVNVWYFPDKTDAYQFYLTEESLRRGPPKI